MMNINCQEYDCSKESLLLRSNKLFHFYSMDTHIRFLLIYLNNTKANMNITSQIIGLASLMSGLSYSYAFCSN